MDPVPVITGLAENPMNPFAALPAPVFTSPVAKLLGVGGVALSENIMNSTQTETPSPPARERGAAAGVEGFGGNRQPC